MKNKVLSICFIFLYSQMCFSQIQDTSKQWFVNSESFADIAKFFKTQGEDVYTTSNGKIVIYDFVFFNLLTKENYIERSTGIWLIGIKTQHPNHYLLFKYNEEKSFEFCNFDNIIFKFNDFLKNVKISDKEKISLLFEILKYLNECQDYPIENLVSEP